MSDSDHLEIPVIENNSQHSGRRLMLGPIDASIVAFVLLWLFHPRLWTAGLGITAAGALWAVEYFHLSPLAVLRIFRSWCAGKRVRRVPGVGVKRIWR